MSIYGFAEISEFTLVVREKNRLVPELRSSEETRKRYPFKFCLRVIFALEESAVGISYHVENLSREEIPFGIDGHHGFRVPLENGESFENDRLEFSQCCQPDWMGFTPDISLSGHDEAFPLENGRILPLKHKLFVENAIILKHMAQDVTLCSCGSRRSVKVSYPDMSYMGIWH